MSAPHDSTNLLLFAEKCVRYRTSNCALIVGVVNMESG